MTSGEGARPREPGIGRRGVTRRWRRDDAAPCLPERNRSEGWDVIPTGICGLAGRGFGAMRSWHGARRMGGRLGASALQRLSARARHFVEHVVRARDRSEEEDKQRWAGPVREGHGPACSGRERRGKGVGLREEKGKKEAQMNSDL